MTSKASLIQYLHQAAFSPPKATLLKAVHNNQFVMWPGLTVKSVKKYLPDSWLGKGESQTGLCILPITDTTQQTETSTHTDNYKKMDETHKQYAHNAHAMTSKASIIQ